MLKMLTKDGIYFSYLKRICSSAEKYYKTPDNCLRNYKMKLDPPPWKFVSSFAVNVNEHLCRIEIKVMIRLRQLLKKWIIMVSTVTFVFFQASMKVPRHQYSLIDNSLKEYIKHQHLKLCCIED